VAIYSIKDLEKLTGIKAHTLRIWEQRYGLFHPKRTPTNIRYYEDKDLKFILKITLLLKHGFKISKIAKLDLDSLNNLASELSEGSTDFDSQLDTLTLSMIEMDELKFDQIIGVNVRRLGFEKTLTEVIQPFLEKLSLLWLTGSIRPVQEQFISNLIRQKLILAIDALPVAKEKTVKKFFIYLPEGESQELSLLLMHYILKSRKHQVFYLGMNISLTDLKDAHEIHQPDFVFTLISETYTKSPVENYLKAVCNTFPTSMILASGYQVMVQNVTSTDNLIVFSGMNDILSYLDQDKTILDSSLPNENFSQTSNFI
jgi:MerR family transcriptional regulator, light-induced transcriptional regulator